VHVRRPLHLGPSLRKQFWEGQTFVFFRWHINLGLIGKLMEKWCFNQQHWW